jgi:cell division protein FtsW
MTSIRLIGKQTNRVRAPLKLRFDYWLALTVAALLVVGMLMIYSTTFDYGVLYQDGDATYYFRRQFTALLLGLGATVVILQFDYHVMRRLSVPMLGLTLLLLFVTLFLGETIFGARRGLAGGSYQPSEVAKLVTILYIAHWLSTKGDRIKQVTYGLVPFSVIVGVVCALIVRQPDLSTAALVALISFTLFFVAGADWRQVGVAGAIGLVVFVLAIIALPHARGRVDAYAIALRDPSQASWHVQQSLIALASGRWFGVGLGESNQKFGLLPAAHTDSVFAVLGEELGLLGALFVIGLFGMLVWRGLRAATKARDSYGSLLALGVTCWLAYQALINIAVITAVVPFTGLPLPFLSYGGSSLAISMVGVGILLNVSRDAALDKKVQRRRADGGTMEMRGEAVSMRWRNRRTHLPGSRRRR